MLHIGEFSALTGLTVKALRHYDEQGLFAPARVDEHSGRRMYASGQIRDALTIVALREADVPLPVIARVLDAKGDVDALTQQRERVLRERRRHDTAFDAVLQTLVAEPVEVAVARRDVSEQAFVGHRLTAEPESPAGEDDAPGPFEGVDVAGPHWVSTWVRDQQTHDLTLCWPAPDDSDGAGVSGSVHGTLPARTELFAHRRTDATGLQDLVWYAEALTRLVEALAAEPRTHRDGFLMRYQVRPVEPDVWDVDVSVVV